MDLITKNSTFFQNEHKLPLNHLSFSIPTLKKIKKVDPNKDITSIRDGLKDNYETKHMRIAALDPHWIQKTRSYYFYQPYYVEVSPEDNACFLEKNRLFLQNIQFLLNCSYQQFWCYVVYEERVKVILDSFVMNAIPWYEFNHLNQECKTLYQEVYEIVARIYCRILNNKESDIEYMTAPHKSNLIFKHKIITFPHVTQLVMLYEKTNLKLVLQLLEMCEKFKGNFEKDIQNMLTHTKNVFDEIDNQLSVNQSNSKFCTTFITPYPTVFDINWFEECAEQVLYILDTAATLNSFLRHSERGLKAAISEQLHFQVSNFYDEVFPAIYQAIEGQGDLEDKWVPIKERIFENIAIARMEFVHLFHQVVTFYLDKIQSSVGKFDEESFDNYLSIITNILEEEFFIFDYHNSFRIDAQFEIIIAKHPNVDLTRLNYVKQCLCNLPELSDLLEKHMFNYEEDRCSENGDKRNLVNVDEFTHNLNVNTKKPTINDEEVEKLVMEVMDTLPHLGDAYILECLHHYEYSTAAVISAVLDDTIPHHVITNPPYAIRVPPELPEPKEHPVLAYKGKKPTYKDAKDLLDDKRELVKVRDVILKASNASYDPYEDEYDERDEDGSLASIAAHNKRVRNLMLEDENDPYKYMVNRFGDVNVASDPSSSDDAEEATEAKGRIGNSKGPSGKRGDAGAASGPSGRGRQKGPYRKPDFCENPELVRERWEASRRGGGPSRDVVGRPRGNGQDTKVVQNRDRKNTNKSSRANHNRKSGAAFKRGKGMFP